VSLHSTLTGLAYGAHDVGVDSVLTVQSIQVMDFVVSLVQRGSVRTDIRDSHMSRYHCLRVREFSKAH
jgi:hypothetical protein